MSPTLFELGVALVMLAVAASLLVWFAKDLSANSEKRMTRMLLRAGVDPELAARGDEEAIIENIRSRCHRCQFENLCERWLAGIVDGDNAFCPNAQVFGALAKTRGPVAAPQLSPR